MSDTPEKLTLRITISKQVHGAVDIVECLKDAESFLSDAGWRLEHMTAYEEQQALMTMVPPDYATGGDQ